MERPVTFFFTKRGLATIICIQVLLILGGVAACLLVFFALDTDVRLRAALSAISLGLAGSAAYYLRRVYRAAFDERLQLIESGENGRERLATALYLLGRPVIAVLLSFTSAIAVILTYTSIAPEGAAPTEDLVYLTSSIGFVTGFLTGRAIEQVEKSGRVNG